MSEVCEDCEFCLNCTNCRSCLHCFSIVHCVQSLVLGPMRSDGCQFVVSVSGTIHAGRLVFASFKDARLHYEDHRNEPSFGDESVRILNFLEVEYKIRSASTV